MLNTLIENNAEVLLSKVIEYATNFGEITQMAGYKLDILTAQLEPLIDDLTIAFNESNAGQTSKYLNSSQYLLTLFLNEYNQDIPKIVEDASLQIEFCDRNISDLLCIEGAGALINNSDVFDSELQETIIKLEKQIEGYKILYTLAKEYLPRCNKIKINVLNKFTLNMDEMIKLYTRATVCMKKFGGLVHS